MLYTILGKYMECCVYCCYSGTELLRGSKGLTTL